MDKESKILEKNQHGIRSQTSPMVESQQHVKLPQPSPLNMYTQTSSTSDSYTREAEGSFLPQGYDQTNKIALSTHTIADLEP